ncbi:LPXTG cell wall anchor domain-containing protein [Thermococcus sp. LS1]|uniref:LPXTG cell wall anchor domain-containing protein n=1 Tax=Thermococcus sp. LS1 TaxID=1638259 RepID=UPI00143A1D71|nr:LPXTG cell wall anchor domain-containing protein [Thermococcus sp. LS1]NJD98654.1 LPXTG cell wall anchor domain-containing protein [Thermococcus sp. LS1]
MRPRMQVSLPLIFPGLLMISTLQIMVAVSGREDGIAAGALFSTVILPFLFAGYYLAKNRKEDIKWVSDVLPIFGFYPFVYAVRSPVSWLLVGLIILIPLLSMRYYRAGDKQINTIVFALSLLACLGISNKLLIVTGMILLSLAFYAFRKRRELQYIASYVILWAFVNQAYKVDYLVLGMGFFFGFAVFVMIHYAIKMTQALQNELGST